MSLVGVGVVFVLVWWIVFFMLLPLGARPAEEVVPGHAPSAPARPRLVVKALAATTLAALLTAGCYLAVEAGWLSMWDLILPSGPS